MHFPKTLYLDDVHSVLMILEQRFELRGQTLGLVKSYTKDNQRADIICN